jgi:hypothetical protein
MTIHVTAVNDVPVAQASSVTTNEDTAKTFAVSDFQFTDVESNALVSIRVIGLSLPAGDTLTVDQGAGAVPVTDLMTITAAQIPSLTYTPAANGNGAARSTLLFAVNDAQTGSVLGPMTINVTAVNDRPVVAGSIVTTNEDEAKVFAVSDFPFTDADNDPLASINVTFVTLGDGDTLTVDSGSGPVAVTDGMSIAAANIPTLTYTPAANQSGTGRAFFLFSASDGTQFSFTTDSLSINVAAVNDRPVAQTGQVTATEDTPRTFDVLEFDYFDVELDIRTSIAVDGLSLASGDTLTVDQGAGPIAVTDGLTIPTSQIASLTYTPAANANGAGRSSFTFTVNDAESGVVGATMTINVTPVNDPPVAQGSEVTTKEDVARAFDELDFGYTDEEGDALVSITIGTLSLATGDALTVDQGAGTVAVTAGMTIAAARIPSLTYTPASNVNGTAQSSFTFRVNDAENGTTPATMTISVTAENDAPTGLQLSPLLVDEKLPAGSLVGAFRVSDADEVDTVAYALVPGPGDSGNAKFSISGNQLLTAAVLNFADQATLSIRVRATDGDGLTVEETLTIVVNSTARPVRNFRAYNPSTDSHFFTTSREEFGNAIRNGFRDESTGRTGYEVLSDAAPNATPIYRLYNLLSGQHYYTTDAGERDFLVSLVPPPATGPDTRKMGWRFERSDGFIYPAGQTGTTAIFRLYNRNSGVHLFTESAVIRDAVLAIPGNPGQPNPWELHATFGFGIPVSPGTQSVGTQSVGASGIPSVEPLADENNPDLAPFTVQLGLIVHPGQSTPPAPKLATAATIPVAPRRAVAANVGASLSAVDATLGRWTDVLDVDELDEDGLQSGALSS